MGAVCGEDHLQGVSLRAIHGSYSYGCWTPAAVVVVHYIIGIIIVGVESIDILDSDCVDEHSETLKLNTLTPVKHGSVSNQPVPHGADFSIIGS